MIQRRRQPEHRYSFATAFLAILVLGLSVARTPAGAPPEVNDLRWCAGSKTCLSWSPALGAASYSVHQGILGSLVDLLGSQVDSCTVGTYSGTSTGSTLSGKPGRCQAFWFLVRGVSAEGEVGPAGSGTGGPRVQDSPEACLASCRLNNQSCSGSGQCCSGTCSGGTCQPSPCCSGQGCAAECGFDEVKCGTVCANVDTDPLHCGGCGAVCSTNHVSPACSARTCTGVCDTGYGDCNNNLRTDGCEVDLSASLAHCGACGAACSTFHVNSPACSGGGCTGTCAGGWRDCNNDLRADGCETSVIGDPNNCGACGNVCPSGGCSQATCIPECPSGTHAVPPCVDGNCGWMCMPLGCTHGCTIGQCLPWTCFCVANGTPCPPAPGSCCSGHCVDGACACRPAGMSCGTGAMCCSGACVGNVCT